MKRSPYASQSSCSVLEVRDKAALAQTRRWAFGGIEKEFQTKTEGEAPSIIMQRGNYPDS